RRSPIPTATSTSSPPILRARPAAEGCNMSCMRCVVSFAASIWLCGAVLAEQNPSHTTDPASKPTPRLPDGRPDFNGTWDNGSGIDFIQPQQLEDGSICISGCPRPASADGKPRAALPPDRPKYKAEFQARVRDLEQRQVEMDPVLRCRAPGVPRIGPPDKIVQIPGQVVFLYDDVSGAFFRIIPTDGRPHRMDVEESYLGDAVGHWEGDTLVVETRNFNEDTWLTDDGAFHTKDLRVTERLTRYGDTMEWV